MGLFAVCDNVDGQLLFGSLILSIVVIGILKIWKHWINLKSSEIPFGYEILGKSQTPQKMMQTLESQRELGSLPPTYPNGWFILFESEQLQRDEVKEVSILGGTLIARRQKNGKVYVVDSCCPDVHLQVTKNGTETSKGLSCSVHGWKIDEKRGTLTRDEPKSNDLKMIKKHEILERNDIIYIWHHSQNAPPTSFPKDLGITNKMKCAGRSELFVNAHIQDIMENQADKNHLNQVHSNGVFSGLWPETKQTSFIKMLDPTSVQWEHTDWMAHKKAGEEHISTLSFAPVLCLFSRPFMKLRVVNLVAEGPAQMSVCFEHEVFKFRIVMIAIMSPVNASTVRFVQRYYFSSWIPFVFTFVLTTVGINTVINDLAIWNRKKYLGVPCLPKADLVVKMFRSWYSQFYCDTKFQEIANSIQLL